MERFLGAENTAIVLVQWIKPDVFLWELRSVVSIELASAFGFAQKYENPKRYSIAPFGNELCRTRSSDYLWYSWTGTGAPVMPTADDTTVSPHLNFNNLRVLCPALRFQWKTTTWANLFIIGQCPNLFFRGQIFVPSPSMPLSHAVVPFCVFSSSLCLAQYYIVGLLYLSQTYVRKADVHEVSPWL